MSRIYIANDLEFSGDQIEANFCLSWGSSVWDGTTQTCLAEHYTPFQRPENRGWEDRCLREFWMSDPLLIAEVERVKRGEGLTVQDGVTNKVQWFEQVVQDYAGGDSTRIQFVSDTCAADNTWMNYLLSQIEHKPIHTFFGYHRDPICTSSYALGLLREGVAPEWGKYWSEDKMVRKKFSIPATEKPTAPHDHNPVHDSANLMQEFFIHMKYSKEHLYNLRPIKQ